MSIVIDDNVSIAQIEKLWQDFKETKEFKKYETVPGKIYWRLVVQQSSKNNNFEFLKLFGIVRKQIVDKIVSLAFKAAAKTKHCLSCVTCVARSVGSTDPTSDYDITITGITSYLIIKEFYIIFRDVFEAEPGDVFDTNVYGGPTEFTIWETERFDRLANDNLYKKVFLKIKEHDESFPLRVFDVREGFLTTLQPKDNETPTVFCTSKNEPSCTWSPTPLCTLERCWAFLAFSRFFHDEYKDFAFEQFHLYAKQAKEDIDNYFSLSRVLQSDVATYQKLQLNKTCRVQPQPTMLKMCYETNYYLTLVEKANDAEKKLYDAIVDKTATLKSKELSILRNNLKNSISHSNMYASEIYVTHGAVLHVVLAMQMKLDLPGLLRVDDLFGSFLENCGFAFHVFQDSKPLDRFVDGPFCISALINGSKYLGRIFDALNRYRPNNTLESAIVKIATVRSEFRGRAEFADVAKATALFFDIVQSVGILKQHSGTCLRNQFLRHYLRWVAESVEKFYS